MSYKSSSHKGATLIELLIVFIVGFMAIVGIIEFSRYLYIKVLLERSAQRGVSIAAWVPGLDGDVSSRMRAVNKIYLDVRNYIERAGVAHLFKDQGSGTANNTYYSTSNTYGGNYNNALYRGPHTTSIKSEGNYLDTRSQSRISTFNGPIMIALPHDGTSYRTAMEKDPLSVLVVLDLKPLTPFLPPFRIRAEAWGYREPNPGGYDSMPLTCADDPTLCDCLPSQRNPTTGLCNCLDPLDPLCQGTPPQCADPVGSPCQIGGVWTIIGQNCQCACARHSTGDPSTGCVCDPGFVSNAAGRCICEEYITDPNITATCNANGGFFNANTCQCACVSGATMGPDGICGCPAGSVERKKAGYPYTYCCPTSSLCTQEQKDKGMVDDRGDASCGCTCPSDRPILNTSTGECEVDTDCGSECG